MFNFELIIREKSDFEKQSEAFSFPKLTVSGIDLIVSNPKGSPYRIPWINKDYVKYWMGSFLFDVEEIEVNGVMLFKVSNFPRYPKLSSPVKLAKNRVSIIKIHKTTNYEKNESTSHDYPRRRNVRQTSDAGSGRD